MWGQCWTLQFCSRSILVLPYSCSGSCPVPVPGTSQLNPVLSSGQPASAPVRRHLRWGCAVSSALAERPAWGYERDGAAPLLQHCCTRRPPCRDKLNRTELGELG